jgi:hypothetical protein
MIAMMIEDQLSDLGCVVIGVAANVAQGSARAQACGPELDCAVLDINLGGEKVYPVAEALTRRGVSFIVSTRYDRAGIGPAFSRRMIKSVTLHFDRGRYKRLQSIMF